MPIQFNSYEQQRAYLRGERPSGTKARRATKDKKYFLRRNSKEETNDQEVNLSLKDEKTLKGHQDRSQLYRYEKRISKNAKSNFLDHFFAKTGIVSSNVAKLLRRKKKARRNSFAEWEERFPLLKNNIPALEVIQKTSAITGSSERELMTIFFLESRFSSKVSSSGGASRGMGQLQRPAIQDALEDMGVPRAIARPKSAEIYGNRKASGQEAVFDLETNTLLSATYWNLQKRRMRHLLGRTPTFLEVYLAYNQGYGGFRSIFKGKIDFRRAKKPISREAINIEHIPQEKMYGNNPWRNIVRQVQKSGGDFLTS